MPRTSAAPRRNSKNVPESRPEKGQGRALAYNWLKRQIVSLELSPGSTIDEATLVQILGVSRTPLREAVVRLAAEGFIELLPNRGARITTMDMSQLQEHLEAFELLQRAATVLAATQRSDAALPRLRELCVAFERAAETRDPSAMIDTNWDFHHAIGLACGNRYIERMYTALLTEGLRIARLAMAYEFYGSQAAYDGHIAAILGEHQELLNSIASRDSNRAAQIADSHSNLARKRVAAFLARSSTGQISVRKRAADKNLRAI